jgi:hypothetical protein
MAKRLGWATVLALLCLSCAAQHGIEREGHVYGTTKGVFRGRWWSYYERGGSFLKGGLYEQAAQDFEHAIGLRSEDAWTARTYGMHFVEYFPQRELGVAYYHLGQLDQAEEYLRKSLEDVDTARAHHYIDLITQARIAQGDLTDAEAPVVAGSVPELLSASREVPLNISAADDIGVAEVRLDGAQLPQRASAEKLVFEDDLELSEGSHTIAIEASDLSGKSASSSLTVEVDLTGPMIGVFEPPMRLVTDEETVSIRGAAQDRNGLALIRVGDRVLVEPDGDETAHFETEAPLSEGLNTFVVVARDMAGNETFSAIEVVKGKPEEVAAVLLTLPRNLLAGLRKVEVRFGGAARYYPALDGDLRFAAQTSTGGGPQIELKFPKKELREYRKQELRIAGLAQADTHVAKISIGADVYDLDLVAGPAVEFSKRVVIAKGKNVIPIRAEDDAGRIAETAVVVDGESVLLDDWRMSVAVQDFQDQQSDPAMVSPLNYLRDSVESLLLDRKRFEVVNRDRLLELLQELKLGTSELAHPDFALRMGKLRPADLFVWAAAYPREDEGIELRAKVVSVETGQYLDYYDVFVADRNDADELESKADEIAHWLEVIFPRVTGSVVLASKGVITNFGQEDGVRQGMYVVVVFEEATDLRDPDTDEVLDEKVYEAVGRGQIVRVKAKTSETEQIEKVDDAAVTPQRGMPAFTM